MSTSGELLCLQANREKRVYCVHAGCFCRLSGSQRARAATPGLEALLQVGVPKEIEVRSALRSFVLILVDKIC